MRKELNQMVGTIPEVADAAALKETFWLNGKQQAGGEKTIKEVSREQVKDASDRLLRFAPYLKMAFPELEETDGIIESRLCEINGMKEWLNREYHAGIKGRLLLKRDSDLPVSGSVKARGGIYEVLKYAEELALEAGMLRETDDYSILMRPEFLEFYSRHTIQVGSTGNLGMSIGIMSAKLGFHVIVHMSADAKQWKKDLLRSRGVEVIEYADDYCMAVEQGRKNSDADPMSYFVDDENSKNLFLGYSVAGERLQAQLKEQKIAVDEEHPLFVYIPCGIGGAPGGITYGLKQIFGDHVHCFFTEPVQACCMMLGMATGLHDGVSVSDFDIDGRTDADGLAVGRPSAFVGRIMEPVLGGIATIRDGRLYDLMRGLLAEEDIFIEPSSCAGFGALICPDDLAEYAKKWGLTDRMEQASHIVWATGGCMVPEETRETYLKTGLSE
ncbi:MAG: D-serine ammonia-lyase [Lachnospiraceae bacterium]|nr:D-serine ammonia-lyase [Lachnospiraceae bacterium]